jgi:hypothetical protein
MLVDQLVIPDFKGFTDDVCWCSHALVAVVTWLNQLIRLWFEIKILFCVVLLLPMRCALLGLGW